MKKTWVRPLGGEDPLEKEIATHSSVLAWRTPWTEELDGQQSMGSQESDVTEWLTLSLVLITVFVHIMFFGGDSNNARREGGRKSLGITAEQAEAQWPDFAKTQISLLLVPLFPKFFFNVWSLRLFQIPISHSPEL